MGRRYAPRTPAYLLTHALAPRIPITKHQCLTSCIAPCTRFMVIPIAIVLCAQHTALSNLHRGSSSPSVYEAAWRRFDTIAGRIEAVRSKECTQPDMHSRLSLHAFQGAGEMLRQHDWRSCQQCKACPFARMVLDGGPEFCGASLIPNAQLLCTPPAQPCTGATWDPPPPFTSLYSRPLLTALVHSCGSRRKPSYYGRRAAWHGRPDPRSWRARIQCADDDSRAPCCVDGG